MLWTQYKTFLKYGPALDMALEPEHRRQRQPDLWEFKASMLYKTNPWPARDAEWSLVSKRKWGGRKEGGWRPALVVVHAFNPSTWESKAGGSLEFKGSLLQRKFQNSGG